MESINTYYDCFNIVVLVTPFVILLFYCLGITSTNQIIKGKNNHEKSRFFSCRPMCFKNSLVQRGSLYARVVHSNQNTVYIAKLRH